MEEPVRRVSEDLLELVGVEFGLQLTWRRRSFLALWTLLWGNVMLPSSPAACMGFVSVGRGG